MGQTKERIYSLDILKYIFACLIALFHIQPFTAWNPEAGFWIENVLTRLGVPFFFAVSGFFLVKAVSEGKKVLFRQIQNLLLYYLLFSCLYWIWEAVQGMYTGLGLKEILIMTVKRFLFYGTYYHLWFFPALIGALVLLDISCRFKVFRFWAAAAAVFYIGMIFTNTWYGAAEAVFPKIEMLMGWFDFTYIRSFLGLAVPYTVLGGVIWKAREYWNRLGNRSISAGIVLSFSGGFLEICLTQKMGWINATSTFFFLMPAVFFIYVWALRHPAFRYRRMGYFLRLSSVLVYGLHPLFFEFYRKILGGGNAKELTLIYILVLLSVEAAAFATYWTQKKRCKGR